MKLTNDVKMAVGQEYFKRKIYRRIAEWFRDFLKNYPENVVNETIIKNQFIVDEIQREVLKLFPKDQVIKYLGEIETYKNSITENDKASLIKMIYYQLPEYRDALNNNQEWLTNHVKQALIAFDDYIFKVKHELKG